MKAAATGAALLALWAAATGAATGAATAGAAEPKPPVIVEPDWLVKPTGDDVSEHYPVLASQLGITGVATVTCGVSASGVLVNCEVVSEAPKGLGFGKATLEMTPLFKMTPQTVNGKAGDGGQVRIPLHFAFPPEEPRSPPPRADSDGALRQALRLVDAATFVEGSLATMQRLKPDGNASAEAREAAASALRAAAQAHREELRDAYARAFASVFTEAEMVANADFVTGPGKIVQQKAAKLSATQIQTRLAYARAARAAAHDAFCARHPCGAPADLERVWRPADPRDGRLDTPVWSTQPQPSAVRVAGPDLAEAIGVTGVARLTCRVTKAGGLEGCGVDEQLPVGLGFGEAALALANQYRLSPIQLPSAVGRKVTVRVGFAPPDLPEPMKAQAVRSERAAELARQITAGEDLAGAARRDAELQILKFESPRPKGVDAKVLDLAVESYRAGAAAAALAGVEQNLAGLAATYSDEELAVLATYSATPAARAQRERRAELQVALGKAAAHVGERITTDARLAFCADRGCTGDPPPPFPAAKPPTATGSKP